MSTALTAPYKNVQVVREFVRQLYGFDKREIWDFIDKTRVQCECLMYIHQAHSALNLIDWISSFPYDMKMKWFMAKT